MEMNVKEYIKDKSIRIFFVICIYVTAGAFLYAAGVTLPLICLTELLFLLTGIALLACDYVQRKRYYESLMDAVDSLEETVYMVEILSKPSFLDGRIINDLMAQIGKHINDQKAAQIRTNREYRQYIESWVHEIKLPIAAAQMIAANHPGAETESIGEELKRIEEYVQQALYYARSESVEKDYLISRTKLKDLVLKELAHHARPMLQAKMRPEVGALDYTVLADTKWCRFILRQVISNAIKYRRQEDARLWISAREEDSRVWLEIGDNGIGISEKDLDRVFEKGFTGENGRRYGESTGMGLYLCKRLCEKLEMDVKLSSVKGAGTKVSIGFTKA